MEESREEMGTWPFTVMMILGSPFCLLFLLRYIQFLLSLDMWIRCARKDVIISGSEDTWSKGSVRIYNCLIIYSNMLS